MPRSRAPRRSRPVRRKTVRRAPKRKRTVASARGSDGLVAELYRQHSLVEILVGRMRETADALEAGRPVNPDRMRRALRVHRGFLMEFHIPCDLLVAHELAGSRSTRVVRVTRECASEAKRATEFQLASAGLLETSMTPGSLGSRTLGSLFRKEADRAERHHGDEAEIVEPSLAERIPVARRRALLGQVRKLYRAHVQDEAALVAWASQNHPSAD